MRIAASIIVAALVIALFSSVSLASSGSSSDAKGALVNVELCNISVNEAIETLFKGRGFSYIIQPGIAGRVVELKIKGVTFDQALKALGDAADFKYELTGNTYVFAPNQQYVAKNPAPVPVSTPAPQPVQPPVQNNVTPSPAQPAAPSLYNNVTIENSPVISMPDDGGFNGYPIAPPIYQFGNMSIIGGGGYGSPVVVTGVPYVMGRGPIVPPPNGWVSPDNLRTLRHQYIFRPRPYFMTPYGYQGGY